MPPKTSGSPPSLSCPLKTRQGPLVTPQHVQQKIGSVTKTIGGIFIPIQNTSEAILMVPPMSTVPPISFLITLM